MEDKAKQQLGELLVNQDLLLDILSKNPNALDNYPDLQMHVLDKSQNSVAYRRAIRNKDFTKEEFTEAILSRIDSIGYDICMLLDLSFMISRVASQVGDDLDAIRTLEIKDFGVDTMSKLLHMMGNAVHSTQNIKTSYPWQSTKGQANPRFWRKADLAYKAFCDGYNSHYKLNMYFQDKFDMPVPQSFPRFIKQYGDPRLIQEWVSWAEYKEEQKSL